MFKSKLFRDKARDFLLMSPDVHRDEDLKNFTTTQYMNSFHLTIDTDGNEHLNGLDAFPLDPSEWSDRDGDGVGDNSDFFPDDPTQWEDPNHAPVAVITGDQVYEATSINGAEISLDASESSDPDEGDAIETYTSRVGAEIYTGENFVITLPIGEHDITLVVNDGGKDSESAHTTVTIQDTVSPVVKIISPENRTYKNNETNPVFDYEATDIVGVTEILATLNGNTINHGDEINLTDLVNNESNQLRLEAKDSSNNSGIDEIIFQVEKVGLNSVAEIIEFINQAVIYKKIRRHFARWIKVQLYLYDYFINRAEFFKNKGKIYVVLVCLSINYCQ